MDTFRDVSPEEAKLLAIKFLGQNLGEIKELDKNIVSGNATLRGNTLKINDIINSVAPNNPALSQQPNVQHIAPQTRIANPLAAPVLHSAPVATPVNDTILNVLNKISDSLDKIAKLLETR
jgi:hypothetical protein